jgi:small subunit ribosomal protein S1
MPSKQNALVNGLIKKEPALFGFLKAGDLVEGKVIGREGNRKLFIDLGRYGTGIVYGAELLNARDIVKNLKFGDAIQAKVINPEDEEGNIELSLTEASRQKAWNEVMEMKEQDLVIKIKPKGFNRGGLIVEINGLLGFLPASQISPEHYACPPYPPTGGGSAAVAEGEDRNLPAGPASPELQRGEQAGRTSQTLQKLVDQELSVKIIEINPRTKKLILSEGEATQVSAKELARGYEVGQVIEGIVSGVADFGVFVRFTDNPEVEGLIHIPEVSHQIVENPKEVVKVDQVIKVKIVDIKDGKISLSLKSLAADPWETAKEHYQERQVVPGTVYGLNPFGALINLAHGLQGQVHITEFGSVEEMKKQLKIKEEYSFLVESVKPQERRIILKLKNT